MRCLTRHPFASHRNFLDPQFNSDGTPYAPKRFKDLVLERYYITKNSHISYEDTGKMTYQERKLIIGFIKEQLAAQEEAMKEAQARADSKRNVR